MKFDVQMVLETEGKLADLASLNAEVLLLGGSKGPPFLSQALDALQRTLPHSRRAQFHGLDHHGPSNWGNPRRVAAELKGFFAEKGELG